MRTAGRVICGWALPLIALPWLLANEPAAPDRGKPWPRHTIDDSSRGSDGVRPADVNGDGFLDLVTGWEEGGRVRAYVNPGPARSKDKWPAVTVGTVRSPEDAVFVDLDADGAVDVVSCCEGNTKSVFVHWAPAEKSRYLHPATWRTEAIPAVKGMTQWMFCLPMQVDGKHGVDLVIGAKNAGAKIGWLEAPANPRDLAAWQWHPLCDAGWIMSLVGADMDGDGDLDAVASDRKGKTRGCLWLENPGPEKATSAWNIHRIGAGGKEVMFLDVVDLDRDGHLDVVVPTFDQQLFYLRRTPGKPDAWETHAIKFPAQTGSGKAVRVGDIDLDGKLDIVLTCGNGEVGSGAVWLSYHKSVTDSQWDVHEISGPSGPKGIKPDLIQLLDLDGDGDLDVITTEERSLLGVVWYENPAR